jgi:hypothetical protein
MNIHAIRITTTEVSDSEGLDAVLPANLPVDKESGVVILRASRCSQTAR